MIKTVLFLITAICSIAQAQNSQPLAEKVRILELNVRQLQSNLINLDNRLRNLESGYIGQPPVGSPEPTMNYSAILVDSGQSKTFLGTGSTRLQAEANARQECVKAVHPSYCNGSVRIGQSTSGSKGFYCVITDSGQGQTFSAEGRDAIEAEARAKQACEVEVHPSYCGNVSPRCEEIL